VLNLHKWGSTPWEPPAVRGEDGKAGSLQMPGNNGGSNWEGGCFDPETGMIYIFSSTQYNRRSLSQDPARSNMNYIDGGGGEAAGPGGAAPPPDAAAGAARGGGAGAGAAGGGAAGAGSAGAAGAGGGRGGRGGGAGQVPTTAFGLQIVKPPYGRITAINMNTGEHVWMQPVGNTPDAIKNHPMLQGVTIPKTGRPGRVGTMVTKTLVWAGERGPLETVNGQQVSWFRGYDKMTGEIVSELQIPANVTNVPMTYLAGGKQYIVIAVAAPGRPAELLALALP
jgi:quinoprotein glucose dehydrogenase